MRLTRRSGRCYSPRVSAQHPAENADDAAVDPQERASRWLESEMRLTELKNEAWVSRFAVVICVIVATMALTTHHAHDPSLGMAVLAIFGAPEPDPEHAFHAAAAALELTAAARTVKRPDGTPVRAGVGVHTGPVVLGSIGSPRRKDYTAIGDTVNTASRIEGLTRDDAADVLVSDEVVRAAGGTLDYETIGPVTVKGRREPVIVHRLRGLRPTDTR